VVAAIAMGGCVWLTGEMVVLDSAALQIGLKIFVGVLAYSLFAIREILWLGRLMGLVRR